MNTSSPDQNMQRQRLQRPLAVQRAFYILWGYFALSVITAFYTLFVAGVPIASKLETVHALNKYQIKLIDYVGIPLGTIAIVALLLFQLFILIKAYHGEKWARRILLLAVVFPSFSSAYNFFWNPQIFSFVRYSFFDTIFILIDSIVCISAFFAILWLYYSLQAKAFYRPSKSNS